MPPVLSVIPPHLLPVSLRDLPPFSPLDPAAVRLLPEAEQRRRVIASALRFHGTPWRHMGDRPGAGVDCAMLLVRAFCDAGIIAPFEVGKYPRSWFLHQDQERLLEWVERLGGIEVSTPQPGDVVTYRYGRSYSHAVLLMAPQLVLHAYYKNDRCMLTETFDPDLADRKVKYFDMWASRRHAQAVPA